jgi:hypothetical protein
LKLIAALALTVTLHLPASAQTICLRAETARRMVATLPTAPGAELSLGFRHSIYGSQVEERFRVIRYGLQPLIFRYGEERLVEFYGHEAAWREAGWWVVQGEEREIPILHLRVSPESSMRLSLGSRSILLTEVVDPGELLHISVAPCNGRNSER